MNNHYLETQKRKLKIWKSDSALLNNDPPRQEGPLKQKQKLTLLKENLSRDGKLLEPMRSSLIILFQSAMT